MTGIKYATERLLDSVWTVAYREVKGGVKIISHCRGNPVGYEQEEELPRMRLIEGDKRIVKKIVLAPYEPFKCWATENEEGATVHNVVNPEHVFDYGEYKEKKMKINVNKKNAEKIEHVLEKVNGQALEWAISTFEEVKELAERAEATLEKKGVLKKNRHGIKVSFTPAGPESASYKYNVITTEVVLVRGGKDWFLASVSSEEASPKQKEFFMLDVPYLAYKDVYDQAFDCVRRDCGQSGQTVVVI